MKNIRKTFTLVLALLLVLSLVGCGSGSPDLTEPDTQPEEDAVSLPDWLPDEFALLDAREDGETFYRYTGSDRDVEFPFYGMTLHLLPEWDGLVDVLIRVRATGERMVYVVNRELMQEHQKLHPEKGPAYGAFEPVLRVMTEEAQGVSVGGLCTVGVCSTRYIMESNGCPLGYAAYGSISHWLAREREEELPLVNELRTALAKNDRYYDRIQAQTQCSQEQLFYEVVEIHEVTKPGWLPENFELSGVQWSGRRGYLYTGTDTEIPMEELGVTLRLPEEWAGKVDIYIYTYDGDGCGIYVVNKNLAQAHLEAMGKHYGDIQPWEVYYDYMLRLAVEKTPGEFLYDTQLGTDGTWHYRLCTNENPEAVGYMNSDMALNEALIYEIGQDAYDALRRELVCTHEQALEIVEIHGLQ